MIKKILRINKIVFTKKAVNIYSQSNNKITNLSKNNSRLTNFSKIYLSKLLLS